MKRSKPIAVALAALLGAAMPMMSAQAAQYTKQEQEAIAAVQGFYDALNARGAAGGESKMPIRPIAEKYLAENYHQNSPGWAAEGQGRESFIRMFQQMSSNAGRPPAGGPGTGGPPRVATKVVYIGGQPGRPDLREWPLRPGLQHVQSRERQAGGTLGRIHGQWPAWRRRSCGCTSGCRCAASRRAATGPLVTLR
jgi:hypothetical protein